MDALSQDGQHDGNDVIAPDYSNVIDDPNDNRRRKKLTREQLERRRRRLRYKRIVRVILALILAFAAYLGYLAVSAFVMVKEAKGAVSSARQLQSSVDMSQGTVNKTLMMQSLDDLSDHVNGVYRQIKSPGWAVLEYIPYYGKDVRAVRDTVRVANDIADDVMPQLRNTVNAVDFNAVSLKDGTVNLSGVQNAATNLEIADTAMNKADADMQAVENGHIGKVSEIVEQAKRIVDAGDGVVDACSRFADIAPSILNLDGSSQARNYLILAQNNAELRATGGMPGSWGVLTVQQGHIQLQGFVPDTTIAIQDQSVVSLTDEERGLFSDMMGRIAQDVNLTPDFPRAGEAAKALWERTHDGQQIDGVIGVDVVALRDMLKNVGAVTMSDGTVLDGSNTMKVLLHDVYARSDDSDWQNEFFSQAAQAAFDQVISSGNLMRLGMGVVSSVQGGHISFWSSHSAEQNRVDGTAISGGLNDTPAKPAVGVYLNDLGQSKMDWYLKRSVSTKLDHENEDGSKVYQVKVTLANTMSADEVASTPQYVLGDLANGMQAGQIGVNVFNYAPAGGRLVSWNLPDGKKNFDLLTTHDGHTVGALQITLSPGQQCSYTFKVQTIANGSQSPLTVDQTPLLR